MKGKKTNNKIYRNCTVLIAFALLSVGSIWAWWACSATTSNAANALCVGDVPEPFGYQRIEPQDKGYAAYLRSLPLKTKGSKVQLYTGGDANYQWLSAAVVDMKLLSNDEQCRNPWFILDDDGRTFHISVFSFAPEELRHY